MSETENISRHSQLKYRLKTRICEDVFNAMPEEIQDFLLEMPQEEIKEAYLNVMLKIPWQQAASPVPPVDLRMAKRMLDRSHYAMNSVKEKVLRYMACQNIWEKIMARFCCWPERPVWEKPPSPLPLLRLWAVPA